MTTEEFWHKYTNENIFEIFDATYDFFSNELPKEFVENYDVGEVILETRGHHETAKKFDEVLKFTELIQEKQPSLYAENFQYFDDFLIDYYCFRNDSDKIEGAFSNFIKNPSNDLDHYLISFRKLLLYGYTNIIKKSATQNYEEVKTTDLAFAKYYLSLEELFLKSNNRTTFSKNEFIKRLGGYDFNFDKDFLSAVESGFSRSISEENVEQAFIDDREYFIVTLEMHFLKYMYNRKFSFALSGKLWDKLFQFLEENCSSKQCRPGDYFSIRTKDFGKYISGLSASMFLDNKPEMIGVLWGSVYVYEFLKSIEIIDQKTFDNMIDVSRELKGKVIGQYTSHLWNSNFVHIWEKPDCISSVEFQEEGKIFQKSFSFKHLTFSRLRSEISEELKNIGELSEFIIKGGKGNDNDFDTSLMDSLLSLDKGISSVNDFIPERHIDPVTIKKKAGRNEPCPCGSGKKYKKCCGK